MNCVLSGRKKTEAHIFIQNIKQFYNQNIVMNKMCQYISKYKKESRFPCFPFPLTLRSELNVNLLQKVQL